MSLTAPGDAVARWVRDLFGARGRAAGARARAGRWAAAGDGGGRTRRVGRLRRRLAAPARRLRRRVVVAARALRGRLARRRAAGRRARRARPLVAGAPRPDRGGALGAGRRLPDRLPVGPLAAGGQRRRDRRPPARRRRGRSRRPGGPTAGTCWPTSTGATTCAWWRSTRGASCGARGRCGGGVSELAWSPDGRACWWRRPADGGCSAPTASARARRRCPPVPADDVAWSPRGNRIAVVRRGFDVERRRAGGPGAPGPRAGAVQRARPLRRVAFSPYGRRLLVPWPDADQWLFLSVERGSRVAAVANIGAPVRARAAQGAVPGRGRVVLRGLDGLAVELQQLASSHPFRRRSRGIAGAGLGVPLEAAVLELDQGFVALRREADLDLARAAGVRVELVLRRQVPGEQRGGAAGPTR